jgi:hypothetical protein
MIAVSNPVIPLSSFRIVFADLFNILIPPYRFDALVNQACRCVAGYPETLSQGLTIRITSSDLDLLLPICPFAVTFQLHRTLKQVSIAILSTDQFLHNHLTVP